MATKTSSKTATGKPAPKPFGAGRKTAAPRKLATSASKTKLPKKEVELPDAATRSKQFRVQSKSAEGQVSAPPAPHPASVSLIDRKKPIKEPQDGEVKT